MKKLNVRSFVAIGMLGSLSFILMLIKFPIPPFPAYLTVDFSDIPALIAALLFGPLAAVIVELIKNAIDYLMIGSEAGIPIGNFANFVAGTVFVLVTYYVFKRLQMKKRTCSCSGHWYTVYGGLYECVKLCSDFTSLYNSTRLGSDVYF